MPFLTLMAVAMQTAAIPQVDYARAAVTPGSWRYGAAPGGTAASFVDSTGTARLVVQCNRAQRIVSVSRISPTAAPTLQLWSSEGTRTISARFEPGAYRVTANIAANDAILDSLAFARGRIAVGMPGAPALVVPSWAEPARAVEDCRI